MIDTGENKGKPQNASKYARKKKKGDAIKIDSGDTEGEIHIIDNLLRNNFRREKRHQEKVKVGIKKGFMWVK